ncbi:MAG: PCMD domain-containing protein [Bacteroidales bacterium]|nr:PCMD domain-containing protein [Bacteroidales bacterium]
MMKNVVRSMLALLSALPLVTSCLFDNDMSYPVIPALITAIEVEGQASSPYIDNDRREVRIVLDELADITDVKLEKLLVSEGASIVDGIPERLDLSSPVELTLETYQKYVWTIYAEQPIARYIEVDNQVQDAEFNLREKMAVVYVKESQDLSSVTFRSVKLEPEGCPVVSTSGKVMDASGEFIEETLECRFPMTLDCVLARTFNVECGDGTVQWTVKVLQKITGLEVVSVNSRCYHAIVKGTYSGEGNPVVEYRKSSESSWKEASAIAEGVNLSADIEGLDADTEYIVRIVNGDEASQEYAFTTESPDQLPNMSFDDWWLNDKVWYPYLQNSAEKVWDSANKATSTFIGSSTTPEEVVAIKGKAVRMESKFAIIAFAAGNIYTGRFNKIDGLGADLDWGVPFTSRPSALKGYYNYSPVTIDKAKEPYEDMKGTTDKCQIQVLLTDWDAPFNVNTTSGRFVNFEKDEHIIAYAKLESDEYTDGWKPFELELEYRDTERIPKYVVITCCASYLGDYFTGGVGSLMYIDEFEFKYE